MTTPIHIKQSFACSAETLTQLLSDNDFDRALLEYLEIQCEILEQTVNGHVIDSKFKMTPSTKLPGFMKKVVKSNAYLETRQWDTEKMVCTWNIDLSFASDKIDIQGKITVHADGENRCYRVNDGKVEVRIPLIGGKIEKFVVAETEKSFEKANTFISNHIKDKGLT